MEINPPHNGHKYFLDNINKENNDILIVIVSTTLVQRGEFSILNKHDKASFLLDNNVDLVIELPGVFANQGGEYFAKHSLDFLKILGITDLYFGSESNDINLLKYIANIDEDIDFKKGIYKNQLSILKSNDILGISYLKSIGDIIPHLIKRSNNDYNDSIENNSNIQSATFIRNNLDDENMKTFLPEHILNQINYFNFNELFPTFLINLNIAINEKINIFLSENMQLLFKLQKIVKTGISNDFKSIISLCKDKNNSQYKISRLIINIILLVDADKVSNDKKYIHVLGFNNKGRDFIKNTKDINLVTSLKNEKDYISEKEILISSVYNILSNQNIKQDFIKPIIKLL